MELSRGTSEAEIAKKDYFSAVAKDIIEKAIYGTLDAAHRYVVRIHTSVCFFFFFGVTLEVPTFIKLNHDCQACDELHAVFHGHAPSKVHCWIIDGTLSEHELWAMSWALNGIGHRIVEVSTFDWVIAVRKAKLQMYAVWQFCFLFFPFISFRLYFCSVVSLHVWAL